MRPPSVLVLGLGNDLLTDDAVGLRVVRAVHHLLGPVSDISVRETMEMGLALLDEIVGCNVLILVDSLQTGRTPPGHVHEMALSSLIGRHNSGPHFLGVGETLALGRRLGLAIPETGRIFAIEVADPFTLGANLTPEVAEAVPHAAALVARYARKFSRFTAPIAVADR